MVLVVLVHVRSLLLALLVVVVIVVLTLSHRRSLPRGHKTARVYLFRRVDSFMRHY